MGGRAVPAEGTQDPTGGQQGQSPGSTYVQPGLRHTELKMRSDFCLKLSVASKLFCGLTTDVRPNLGLSNIKKPLFKLNTELFLHPAKEKLCYNKNN